MAEPTQASSNRICQFEKCSDQANKSLSHIKNGALCGSITHNYCDTHIGSCQDAIKQFQTCLCGQTNIAKCKVKKLDV